MRLAGGHCPFGGTHSPFCFGTLTSILREIDLGELMTKPALLLLCVLLSLLAGAQQKSPDVCRGKSLPITLLPGPEMTGLPLPLRFGGTRPYPRPWVNSFKSDKPFRLVIKSRDEFADFWKRLLAPVPPGQWRPALPDIDFTKEMIVVSAMGMRPSASYLTIIDGACEVDGQIEVFITNYDGCGSGLAVITYPADAVRIPRSDLPIEIGRAHV